MGNFTVDTNNVVVVRSEGLASDGRSGVVLEMTMGSTGGTGDPGAGGISAVLCDAGKNGCDDNNSVENNVVVSN
jgi:hypothetical protein